MEQKIEKYKKIMAKITVGKRVYDRRNKLDCVITGIKSECGWKDITSGGRSCNECIGLIQLDNGEYRCHSLNYSFWLDIKEDFLTEEDVEIK